MSYRELTALLERVQSAILKELSEVRADLDAKLKEHKNEHLTEEAAKSSLIRWAVTTVVSVSGIAFSLWLGITDKI